MTVFAAQDKVLEVVLLECCELLGRYVVPESYLPHILSRIKEEPDMNLTRSRCNRLKEQPGRKHPPSTTRCGYVVPRLLPAGSFHLRMSSHVPPNVLARGRVFD